MTGIVIDLHVRGLSVLTKGLMRMSMLGENPRSIWDAIGNYGENSTRLRFERQIDPDRKRWVPSIRAREVGGQTLKYKLHLLRSIGHNADNKGATWGTNKIYAGVHQFGAVIKANSADALRFRMPGGKFVTTKKVTIPARPFVGVNADDVREILSISAEIVDTAARNRGEAT